MSSSAPWRCADHCSQAIIAVQQSHVGQLTHDRELGRGADTASLQTADSVAQTRHSERIEAVGMLAQALSRRTAAASWASACGTPACSKTCTRTRDSRCMRNDMVVFPIP